MLDQIDQFLISALQENGRRKKSDLAREIGMSVPAVAERMKKLLEMGVIRGFTAQIDPRKLGLDVGAVITIISARSTKYSAVVEQARQHPEVLECMSVTGDGSHLLIVRTANTSSLENLLREIQAWPGVNRTETRLILSHYKQGGPLPVAPAALKPQQQPKEESEA